MHQNRKLFMLRKQASSSSSNGFFSLFLLGYYLLWNFLVINMTKIGGTKHACAACKYQRRKCAPDCPFARYFPADQPKVFLNAHRLFRLSNIARILNKVDSDKKDEAMRTIIFESTIRAKYPVHGCWGIIGKLQHHIQSAMNELQLVRATLARYKECDHFQVPSSTSLSEISTALSHALNRGQTDMYAETGEILMKQNGLKVEENFIYNDAKEFPITIPELQIPEDYDYPFDTNGFININPCTESSR